MNRAYSVIAIKAVNEDDRVIEGIASTPSPDRMGDIVEPLGAKFKLPMPLLWQHDATQPIGEVFFAKPNKEGIPFKAKIAKMDEPGTLKDRLDEAWQSIKIGLVKAVSIGFRDLAYEIIKDGGFRFTEWEWLELSAVTIPAQAEATIQTIKSISAGELAASGRDLPDSPRPATGKKSTPVVKAKEAGTMKKTIQDQVKEFEATRQAKAARMTEIMDTAAEKGETLDEAQKQEYDTLDSEIKSVDDHLVRLRNQEKLNVEKAVPVAGETKEDASNARAGVRVEVRGGNAPKGIGFIRLLAAKTNAYLSKGQYSPLEFVKAHPHWQSETPEVEQILKTAVSAGTTTDSTWAGPLVQYTNLASEFVEYLRPLTIIGRVPGFRRVPFKVKFPRQTAAAVANWVGEGKPKPATSLAFDSITLDPLKVAGIVPITMELMRLSSPSAELIIRDDLAGAIAQLVDNDFVDPAKTASSNVSPASITNGVSAVAATGTAYANLKTDVKSVMDLFLAANITPDTIIMRQSMALSLSLMETSLGQPQFPGLTMNGGKLFGLDVVTSENIPVYSTDGDTPIIFLRANDIALADEGGVEVDVSTEASIEMSTAPTDPVTASTVLVSLWQQNLVGIRAERMINWVKRRDDAVQVISGALYA